MSEHGLNEGLIILQNFKCRKVVPSVNCRILSDNWALCKMLVRFRVICLKWKMCKRTNDCARQSLTCSPVLPTEWCAVSFPFCSVNWISSSDCAPPSLLLITVSSPSAAVLSLNGTSTRASPLWWSCSCQWRKCYLRLMCSRHATCQCKCSQNNSEADQESERGNWVEYVIGT